ncbi:MAG TPA: phage holin family protein [Sphingomicrobium sp.]|nr:phage holin family protein [Sphingomicrobium sp.]
MLKPAGDGPPPGGDRSFGELASQLVEDAKSYAHAEVDLAKAIAADKTRSFTVAAIFFAAAALVAIGAMCALSVAIFVSLAMLMSPVLAGLTTFVLVGAVAAGLGWLGWQKLKDAL